MGAAHSALVDGECLSSTDGRLSQKGHAAGLKGFRSKVKSKKQRNPEQSADADAPQQPANGSSKQASKSSTAVGASFLAWAKRQSKQRNKPLQEFLIESAQLQAASTSAQGPAQRADAPHAASPAGHADAAGGDGLQQRHSLDVLGLQDVLSVLACEQQKQLQTKQQGPSVLEPFRPHDGYVKGPPKPHCHEGRVVAADGIQALRRTRDGELESMLRLLCKLFDVETATVALLTGQAIYITAACGALQSCVCPDRWGFCGWSFLNSHHELLVVEDMDQDARFSANFFVVDPTFSLKFYVAAPLISSNGHRLGTLCVMGQQARKFDAVQGQVLSNLAEMLVRQLEEKWVVAMQSAGTSQSLRRATSCYSSSYLVLDLSSRPWRVLHMNEPAVQATGAPWTASYAELACYAEGRRDKASFEGMALDTLFDVSRAHMTWTSPGTWEFTLSGLTLAAGSNGSNGSSTRYSLTCKPAASDGLDEDQPFFVGVPSWLALSESNQWGRNYFFARLEPEQQQQQQQPFNGDSVEQLHMPRSEGLSRSGSNGAAAAAAGTTPPSSDSNVDSGVMVLPAPAGTTAAVAAAAAPAEGFVWLPRGHAAAGGCGSSAGSNAGSSAVSLVSSAASSPLSSSRSLGSFHISAPFSTTTSSSNSSSSGGSGSRLAKVAPSVMSVATNNSGGSVSSHVGSLVRGLPIAGLVMGPLLGRGSYGRVYRGLLKGRPVAVKIIDDVTSLRLNSAGEPLEISLTRDLRQTGVMATLGYAYADAAATPSFTRSGSSSRRSSAERSRGPVGSGHGSGSRFGQCGGTRTCWMVFEYCDKGILADAAIRGWFRTQRNPLTGAPHLRVIGLTALEIAAAMQHLHAKKVLHGDLCGGNVMLASSSANPHGFTAKVGDFGLVRTAAAAATDDNETTVVHPVEQRLASNLYGTITHQPPEVLLEGSAAFTAAADVYAWGVLLWEMLTGSRAWAGMAAPSVVVQVAVLKRSLAIPTALPPVFKSLLAGALNPDPLQRPTFGSIVEQLTAFVQQSRAVDWEAWQGEADAAHAAQTAAIKAAEEAADAAAAAEGGDTAEATAGGVEEGSGGTAEAPGAGAVTTGMACGSCPLAGRARDGVPV